MNSRNVCFLSLLDRLHLIRTWVTNPLNQLIASQKLQLPFRIRMKPMYTVEQSYFVWNEVVKQLTHESDGLIFTPIHDPYILGPCLKLLKWKPLEFNSADFKIGVITIRRFYEFIHSFSHSLVHSLFHSLFKTHSLTHSLFHSLTLSLFHSLFHSSTHSLTHSLTLSLIHSLTHSLTHS